MVKKVISFLMIIGMVLCVAGCETAKGDNKPSSKPESSTNSIESQDDKTESDVSSEEEKPDGDADKKEDIKPEKEPETPRITQLCDYIGKTAGTIKATYGSNFEFGSYEGSSVMDYSNKKVAFILDKYYDDFTSSAVANVVISLGTEKVIGPLYGSMTYSQIVSAVGSEVNVGTPEHWFNEMEGEWTYSLDFKYRGYLVMFTWYDDPNTTPAFNCAAIKR